MTRRYWNINLKEMIEAGVHFGHGIKKWNPKMAPYISAKRKGTHITNLARTAPSQGKSFLIVGTKKRAADLVASAAIRSRCHYVNKKWFSDAAILKRKLSTLQRYLGGIKYMTRLPDIVIVLDQQKEYIALRECAILGIPTISLVDTNCDPDLANISIPANDDTMTSIRLILNKLVFAISEGRSLYIRNR
ncbi:hypothetical protein SETIT_J019200v2 [Setaria italica]|uniref:Small ribosomal subunit protein uS2c n=1 Tax=Setaria italica TaxID=4555 RepID=A0A368PGT4_SETIT|nr:hypothetical protein SETIT_J019200v2 [Setaria italica]